MFVINKEIEKAKTIFFFDIDSTLSSSIDEQIRIQSDEDCDLYAKKHGFEENNYKSFYNRDFCVLQQTSLDLFGYLLKITNAKAISVSSWFGMNTNEDTLTELETMFSLLSNQFPEKWLIGASSGSGGDRYSRYIEPIKNKYPEKKIIAIDDGADQYKKNKITIKIDSKLGFNYYDFIKALKMLGYNDKLENDYLNLTTKLKEFD